MAIITTYVCDISGKQGSKEDFMDVNIVSAPTSGAKYNNQVIINKLVHKDVAAKLHLSKDIPKADVQPEPTLESKLAVLLKEYIDNIAYEAGSEAGAEAASNYNRGG